MATDTELTTQQEHFCQLIALERITFSAAYRQAYNVTTRRKQTTYTDASELLDKPKVIRRIVELRNATLTPKIAPIIERKEHATTVLRDKEATHRDQLSANMLLGEYEKELGPATTPVVPTNNTYNTLSLVINEATPTAVQGMLRAIEAYGEDRLLAALASFMESQEWKQLSDGGKEG